MASVPSTNASGRHAPLPPAKLACLIEAAVICIETASLEQLLSYRVLNSDGNRARTLI